MSSLINKLVLIDVTFEVPNLDKSFIYGSCTARLSSLQSAMSATMQPPIQAAIQGSWENSVSDKLSKSKRLKFCLAKNPH